jgi:hypothetical protein
MKIIKEKCTDLINIRGVLDTVHGNVTSGLSHHIRTTYKSREPTFINILFRQHYRYKINIIVIYIILTTITGNINAP